MKLEYQFIGWNRNDVTNTDKIWVCINLTPGTNWAWPHKYLTVWGRRGARLQHKVVECTGREMGKLIDSKWNKGYRTVTTEQLDQLYPEFESDLEKTAAWVMLSV